METLVERQIVRNGNSAHICLPRPFLDFLQWHLGDRVAVEITARGTIEIRPMTLADLQLAQPRRLSLHDAILAKAR